MSDCLYVVKLQLRSHWALLRDATLRVLAAADVAGVRAILVHALSEDAKRFYERCGFAESPTDPMTLVVTLKDVKTALDL